MPNFTAGLAFDSSIDFSLSLGLVDAVLLPSSALSAAVSFSTSFPATMLQLGADASLANRLETPDLVGTLNLVLDIEGRLLQEPLARGIVRLNSDDLFDADELNFSLSGMGDLLALASLDPFFLLSVIRSWARSAELQADFLSFRVPGLDATAGQLLLGDGTDGFVSSFLEASEGPTPVSDRKTLELVLAGRPVEGNFTEVAALAASLAPKVDNGYVQLALAVNEGEFVVVPISQSTVLAANDTDSLVNAVNVALAETALSGLVFARAAVDTYAGTLVLDFYTAAEVAATRFTASVQLVERADSNRRRRHTFDGDYSSDSLPRSTHHDAARRRFMAQTLTSVGHDSDNLFQTFLSDGNNSARGQTHYRDHEQPVLPRRRQPRGMRATPKAQERYASASHTRRRRLVGPPDIHPRSRRQRLEQEGVEHHRTYGPLNVPGTTAFQAAAEAMQAHFGDKSRMRRASRDQQRTGSVFRSG